MAANTGQSAPDDHWLGLLQEDILEPDLPIIDPHHHLWLRNGYTYLMPELAADLASGHNIVATVFAECHSMYRRDGVKALRSLGETEFVRGQAAMSASGAFGSTRACEVMFGNVDLTLGGAVEPLDLRVLVELPVLCELCLVEHSARAARGGRCGELRAAATRVLRLLSPCGGLALLLGRRRLVAFPRGRRRCPRPSPEWRERRQRLGTLGRKAWPHDGLRHRGLQRRRRTAGPCRLAWSS